MQLQREQQKEQTILVELSATCEYLAGDSTPCDIQYIDLLKRDGEMVMSFFIPFPDVETKYEPLPIITIEMEPLEILNNYVVVEGQHFRFINEQAQASISVVYSKACIVLGEKDSNPCNIPKESFRDLQPKDKKNPNIKLLNLAPVKGIEI